MAPKTLYDAGEVQKKVTETGEKAVKTLKEEGWEFSESIEITCDYLGAATADGYTLDRQPALLCTVGFKWSYREESTNESLTKRVRGSLRLLPEPRHHLPRALELSLIHI